MKKTLLIAGKTRTFLFIIAGLLVAGMLLVSCGGGGYGGGGGGSYGGGMSLPPAKFNLISPTNGMTLTTTTATLEWGSSLYAMGYYVYLSSDGRKTYAKIATTTGTSFMTATLNPSAPYDWKVTAFSNGGIATAGPWTFTTGP